MQRQERNPTISRIGCLPAVLIGVYILSPQVLGQTPDSNSGTTVTSDIRDRNLYEPAKDNALRLGKKLAVNVALDQKRIWESPFRMNKRSAPWWLAFGAGTAALIASDHHISEQLPNTGISVTTGNEFSRAGQFYSVYPFAGSLYLLGLKFHDRKLSKTGALGVQALTDSAIVANVLKVAARRERPLNGDGGGHFEKGGSSFPSGHSIEAWTLAAVAAKEYGNHKWVPLVSYAYASAVSLSRVSARQHFPSDVFAGAAMGFFIGRYVATNNEVHENHVRKVSGLLQPSPAPYLAGGGIGLQLKWRLGVPE